jgi:hypothetical protein
MKRINLYLIFFLIISVNSLYSQNDSLKTFVTKDFDLLCAKSVRIISEDTISGFTIIDLINCNRIRLLNDSSFMVTHYAGSSIVLYDNINQLSVSTDENNFGKGLGQGALYGLISGLAFDLLYLLFNEEHGDRGFWKKLTVMVFAPPAFTIAGTITGGIIGLFTYDKETYSISDFPVNRKKEKILDVLFKFKVDF